MTSSPSILAGHLLVTGFTGPGLSTRFAARAANGERAGAVLFRRNGADPPEFLALTTAIARVPVNAPLLVAIDQEGGRVERLGPPFFTLPSAKRLAAGLGGTPRLTDVANAQAEELASLGFTMNFAPVLDVNTEEANPIIGDRAFGTTAAEVTRHALAFAEGLRKGGVLACGKHYPGHGHTTQDSHVALPTVARPRAELDAIDLAPFAAAAVAGFDALMSAHVMYPALDPANPATLSPSIATTILRDELRFRGALFSDDLEMKALSPVVEETSVAAVLAGCDLLLVCADEDLADRAHGALVREIEASPAFRARAIVAGERGLAMRRRCPPRPASRAAFEELVRRHAPLHDEVRARCGTGLEIADSLALLRHRTFA